jgi:beta-lactamase class A
VKSPPGRSELEQHLRAIFAEAHCQGFLHAVDVVGGLEVELDADALVTSGSVFKVQVGVEFFRQVAAGVLNPSERVLIEQSRHTAGPSGISQFADPVEVSLRDLALQMLTISDNTATDVLMAKTGLARVQALGVTLGLERTFIGGDVRWMLEKLAVESGFENWAVAADADIYDAGRVLRALEPERTTHTSARDSTALLSAIWTNKAAPKAACAEVRRMMSQQLTRDRIGSGFPRSVRVSAKSGGLLGFVINEIGVVEPANGRRYAVAIFTTTSESAKYYTQINAAIGIAARDAVAWLEESDPSLDRQALPVVSDCESLRDDHRALSGDVGGDPSDLNVSQRNTARSDLESAGSNLFNQRG